MYISTQSWWTPQPTTNEMGHIHVEMDLPIPDTIHEGTEPSTGYLSGTFELPVKLVSFHGAGGTWKTLKFSFTNSDLDFEPFVIKKLDWVLNEHLAERWETFTIDTTTTKRAGPRLDGWHIMTVIGEVQQTDGKDFQIKVRHPVYLKNGNEMGFATLADLEAAKSTSAMDGFYSGNGWYGEPPVDADPYVWAQMDPSSLPINPIPYGEWTPTVRFTGPAKIGELVTIDPNNHMHPPFIGRIVHQVAATGTKTRQLSIKISSDKCNPNYLTPGLHKLFIRCIGQNKSQPEGEVSGVLVVPFTVTSDK